jgi:uncharacterized protein
MFERDGFIHGVPCWVDTGQPDPEAAVSFYRNLFGWEFEDRMPADSPGRYFVAQLQGKDVAGIGSRPDIAPPTPVWTTYMWVDSADETATKLEQAGGRALMEPFDVSDSGRMGVFADPHGAVFCVWQANKRKGTQIVNAPGSWNFSNLNTDDIEGSKSFYGAVFGWEADTMDFGEGDYALFRLPGYGDFLEAFDPELRTRLSNFSAPPGFEDAVAGMVPLSSDQQTQGVPPHWSVTFAVDDTDAIVEKATQLGGRVLVPPFDAPPVRAAVLSDPQGAVFTVSKFDPQ